MSSKRTNVLWTIVPPFSDCVPRGQDHLQSLPRSTTTCKWSRNQNHIKLLRFNLSLKWKLTSLSVSSSSLVEMQLWVNVIDCSNGSLDGGFHDHNHCHNFHDHPHVQRNEQLSMIFNIFQLHLPDICVAIPAGVSNLKNWYRYWNDAQVERVNAKRMAIFDSKTYKSTHVFCVCVSPLLKAPLLLADWLPARNLRVSFSFS